MKHRIKELSIALLLLISLLWLLGTAGAVDHDRISMGQATVQLAVGIVGLGIAAVLINTRKEVQDGEDNQH